MSFLDDAPIVIAEIGGNHGGSLGLAKEMVSAAVEAGTPYVKFQTYQAERLVSRDHPAFDAFAAEALSFAQFRELKAYCDQVGAVFLSTPFDPDSADFLDGLDVVAIKIASGDLNYISLLDHVSRKNRPILLSTGSSTFVDIDRAVNAIQGVLHSELVLLHCTAAYPCPDEEANLAVIPELAKRYLCRVGFSDHTLGGEQALAAVGLGAVVIEKHFTIDQTLPGGDNDISLMPGELGALCRGVKRVYAAIGSPDRQKTATECKSDVRVHRSLVARRDLKANEVLRAEDLDAVRPGDGIPPTDVESILGKRLNSDIEQGHKITSDHLS